MERFYTCKKINNIFLKLHHSLLRMPKAIEIVLNRSCRKTRLKKKQRACNAPINVMPAREAGGAGGGMALGRDLIAFVCPGIRHLIDIVLPDVEIFDCRLGRKRLRPNMFPASTLHACAVRSGKIRKSWRPTGTSKS